MRLVFSASVGWGVADEKLWAGKLRRSTDLLSHSFGPFVASRRHCTRVSHFLCFYFYSYRVNSRRLDLQNLNANDTNFESIKAEKLPDVVRIILCNATRLWIFFQILVKKVFDKTLRRKKRNWKLKRLNDQLMDTESLRKYVALFEISNYIEAFYFSDYNEFLDDLEEDPLSRQHVNIYKSK